MTSYVKYKVSPDGFSLFGKLKDVQDVFHYLSENLGDKTIKDYAKEALSYKNGE
jgi:hypothetical protein